MLAMLIWRLGAIFLFVNTGWGLDYQHPSEEYSYHQQPLQHYDGYEIHRQYRSAGDEPTTTTPSVTLKHENLSENQTILDSDVGNNSTHTSTRDINDMFPSDLQFIDDADVVTLPDGSITLVTDVPVESTSMASTVPSLLVGRDTSKSVLESSDPSSMEQLNVTTERVDSTSDNSTVEAIKVLKRRQAQQVLIQQVPVQPQQQVPLSVFQPLPVQSSQFIQAPPTLLFSGQPGQPALVHVPFGQSQFVPNQLRFVQPPLLVPQQVVPLQNSQASVTLPVQALKSPPKLTLNPVPLPPTISLPHPNMTIHSTDNDSQANAVKTREANANRVVPKAQPLMGAFKPMVSPMPPRPTPPPAPVRVSPVVPTTTLQTPVQMMQVPVQPMMVRPQLQGQQAPPQSKQAVVVQNTTPLPRGLMVRPEVSLEAHNGQPTPAVQFPASTTLPLPSQTGQRSGSPMDLQPQQQQPQLSAQAIPVQVIQRSGPQMDQSQHPLPMVQSMNQPPSSAQHSVPLVNQPSQPQPMSQAHANQPPSPQSMGQVQQQTMAQPLGQAPQAQVQRSGPVMDQSLQHQPLPVGQSEGQPPSAQVAQRSGFAIGQQPMSLGQPMGQAPPAQTVQRSGPPMEQSQILHPSQSMNQASSDAQRSGPSMNQPPQPQPTNQPMSQTQVAQQPGTQLTGQPVGQTNVQAVQHLGPPMEQSLHQQPLPVGQAPPSQVAQRSGSPMDQPQQPTSASQLMGQAPPTQVAQRSGPSTDQPQLMHPSQSMNQPPSDAQRSEPPVNQQSQPQPMGQASPAQVGQRTGPLLVNQPPSPITSQQLGQPLGSPNIQPPPPPPPPQPQPQFQQLAQQMGLNQQPPQPGPPIAPRINSPMNPAPSPMMDSPQSVNGASLPVSQFNQRSVQDGRVGQGHGEHQMNLVPSNEERHFMRRSVDAHRMRRQMDTVPYPSKEAYDSYVVNNYHNLYNEVYPTYTPVYTTTTAAAPKYEYYVPRY